MRRLVSLSLAFALACTSEPTQLVVVVDTDLPIPARLDEIRVSVTGPSGMSEVEGSTFTSRTGLPVTVGVSPSGDELGPIRVVATGLRDGIEVVQREHRVTLVRGESRMLLLHLIAACAETECGAGETCGENGCVDVELDAGDLPAWSGTPPRIGDDAGPLPPRDAGFDAQRPDASDGDGGSDGGPVRCESVADCDDGNACTDDACTVDGCTHAPSTASCDDGLFCNGLDACASGACAHAGSPCGALECDEAAGTCLGCPALPCPADSVGAWGECVYESDCVESGIQSRTVRQFSCTSGACVPNDTVETRVCTRDTDTNPCGPSSCPAWGDCGGFSNVCDESGTESRSCSEQVCVAGSCATRAVPETRACTRSAATTVCEAASCDAWGPCGGFSDTCDESGTRTRTCYTQSICSGGSCPARAEHVEAEACARPRAGVMCAPDVCGGWNTCTGTSTCDQTGTQSRTCTAQVCGGGVCGVGAATVQSQGCPINSDGLACNDGIYCTRSDRCFDGFCDGIPLSGCIEP